MGQRTGVVRPLGLQSRAVAEIDKLSGLPATAGLAEAGLWRVALDTTHFSFEAYGATLGQANRAFDALIDAHVTQTGADPQWARSAKRDATVYEVRAGTGIRDHDVIVKEIE